MSIRDALWACPFCATIDSIRPADGSEKCTGCGTVFQPGPRATVIATPPGGGVPHTGTVEEWEQRLPDLQEAASILPPPTAAVIRKATPPRPVHRDGRLLGWAESFGPKTEATVRLDHTELRIQPGNGPEERWPLESVVAVQPSSSSVQLRSRSGELISFKFPDSSVRLWEIRFQEAVKACYIAVGKGVISEFHPTIRVL